MGSGNRLRLLNAYLTVRASLLRRKLLIGVAIPKAGAEIVAAALSKESEANAPLEQDRLLWRGSNHDTDVIREVTLVSARQLHDVAEVVRHPGILPMRCGRYGRAIDERR